MYLPKMSVSLDISHGLRLIFSATLSEVETLKYPPFHGICFLVEIFSFFSLVSNFSK